MFFIALNKNLDQKDWLCQEKFWFHLEAKFWQSFKVDHQFFFPEESLVYLSQSLLRSKYLWSCFYKVHGFYFIAELNFMCIHNKYMYINHQIFFDQLSMQMIITSRSMTSSIHLLTWLSKTEICTASNSAPPKNLIFADLFQLRPSNFLAV